MNLKKQLFIFLCLVLTTSAADGQKLQYGGMQQFGLVFGEKNTDISFHFINGIRFKRFFTGIGADVQFVESLAAIYADGRYYINKKKNFFAVAEGGMNLVYESMPYGMNSYRKKQPGYYCAFGIGFKARVGAEIFYSFDLSYNIRQTRIDYHYIDVRNMWQVEKYDFRQHAILLRMGIEIF